MFRVLTRYVTADDVIAGARRAREEEWRAMHRRPDAPPLPAAPEREPRILRSSVAMLVRRVGRLRIGSSPDAPIADPERRALVGRQGGGA
jgi:hypothetical protein